MTQEKKNNKKLNKMMKEKRVEALKEGLGIWGGAASSQ